MKEYIIKELQNGAQSGYQIKKSYDDDPTTEEPADYNKTFSAAFDKLLKDYEIFIIGYDGGLKRNQNITYANLIYSLLEAEIFEIRKLIRKLDAEDGKEAYNKLLNLFTKKIQKIKKEEFEIPIENNYDEMKSLFDNVISYINYRPNKKDELIEDLSIGLSESEESYNRLHNFVQDVIKRVKPPMPF